jgi:hypothetical protein
VDDVSDWLSPEVSDGEPSVPTKVGESRKLDKFASRMGSDDGKRVVVGDSGVAYSSHFLTASCWGLIGVGIARGLSNKTGKPKRSRGLSESWVDSRSRRKGSSGSITGSLENCSNSS